MMNDKCAPSQLSKLAHLQGARANSKKPEQEFGDAAKCQDKRNAAAESRVACVINALAQAIGGQALKRWKSELGAAPGLYLPRADLLLLGTVLARPSVLDEAKDLAHLTGNCVAVVRVAQDGQTDRPFTVDILIARSEHWVSKYIPWQFHASAELWLVPSQGEGRSFRFSPVGLLMSPRAPFSSLHEREYGFGLAMRSITNMMGAR